MHGRLLSIPLLLLTAGCGASGGGGDDDGAGGGGGSGAVEATCDATTHRAVLEGTFTCPADPELVTIPASDEVHYSFDIFKYEASHPLGTDTLAFPCAVSKGDTFEAPKQVTPACSRPGVRPWHSVRWEDADHACKAAGEGWRLCTGGELLRACAGPQGYAYTFGGQFRSGVCNVREAYKGGDGVATEAPTGDFDNCKSVEGAFDLTGNMWEWTDDRENNDPSTRVFQGAGWRTIAERHRDTDLVCGVRNVLPGISARTYANPDVGFRCCRTASGG
jgi:hypothetical protein